MSKIFEALRRAQTSDASEPAKDVPPEFLTVAPHADAAVAPSRPVGAVVPQGEPARTIAAKPAIVRPIPERPSEPAQGVGRLKAVVVRDPNCVASEQYRMLRASLLKLRNNTPLHIILVASPGAGDGKTTTSLNLAAAIAQAFPGEVVLVGGDLRRPGLRAVLPAGDEAGVSDFLGGAAELEDIIHESVTTGLNVVSSGRSVEHPGDLLHSPRMESLMASLRERFDWVIVDGPPVGLVADHEVLANFCDGILLVVRPGHTPRELLRHSIDAISRAKLLGLVVNAVDPSRHAYGYYAAYGYNVKSPK